MQFFFMYVKSSFFYYIQSLQKLQYLILRHIFNKLKYNFKNVTLIKNWTNRIGKIIVWNYL